MSTVRLLHALALCASLLLSGACGRHDDGVIRRPGHPDYVEVYDEARMDAAIAEAKSTLDRFDSALEVRAEGTDGYSIKKGFPYGEDSKEFIWVDVVRAAPGGYVGTIGNKPVHAVDVAMGSTVHVDREDVVDWMYLLDGRLRGGYTIVALSFGSPEQADYERTLGIDWSLYKFLEGR